MNYQDIVFICGEYCVTKHEAVGEAWYNVRPMGAMQFTRGTFGQLNDATLFIDALLLDQKRNSAKPSGQKDDGEPHD